MLSNITASFIIIGNEILSGRTQDKNLNYLAKILNNLGISLQETRIIPDIEAEIIATVNSLSKKYTYVFTSGGIGPTHDDITSLCIAKAFSDELIIHQEAKEILYKFYGPENVNEARMKMATLPSKAKLLNNPISSAPGFYLENVFVMAGIPKIFQAMVDCLVPILKVGSKIYNLELTISLTESVIAQDFANLQKQFPLVIMGSYPFDGGTSLVFRATDLDALKHTVALMKEKVLSINSQSIIKIDE
ncbi:MAG: competence/damage-inducible protein A [Proteobacteria bacterium]|jgi:molybdenum cofactor synthesis domain-containing protein|nr:competence/damage-inducible protein A [Pseudomonadota bacterium]